MNIEQQVKNLYKNASKLDEEAFLADFYYIAKEYARQQGEPAKSPLNVDQHLLDEAIDDVIVISQLNCNSDARKFIQEQYFVVAKEDLVNQ